MICPQLFFESTITNLPPTSLSPPPERPPSALNFSMTPSDSEKSPSPIPTSSTIPQELEAPPLADHEKFSTEQKDFLRSHLPAYRAHCAELDKLGRGPRKLAGVKGSKRDWVYKYVYPEFSRKFSSGSNTQSLKQVCLTAQIYFVPHLPFLTLHIRKL